MTPLQLLMLGVFAVVALAAYAKDIYSYLSRAGGVVSAWASKRPRLAPVNGGTGVGVVDDLLLLASLRDKFQADNCAEGVEACSALLKIIVDHKHPHAG